MVAANKNNRQAYFAANVTPQLNQLKAQVQTYFYNHPEVPQNVFLLDAVRRELYVREQADARRRHLLGHHDQAQSETAVSEKVRPVTDDFAYSVVERLAELNYRRHGVWPRVHRTLAGTILGRWLGLRPEVGETR